jgi:hypothetical protein
MKIPKSFKGRSLPLYWKIIVKNYYFIIIKNGKINNILIKSKDNLYHLLQWFVFFTLIFFSPPTCRFNSIKRKKNI